MIIQDGIVLVETGTDDWAAVRAYAEDARLPRLMWVADHPENYYHGWLLMAPGDQTGEDSLDLGGTADHPPIVEAARQYYGGDQK